MRKFIVKKRTVGTGAHNPFRPHQLKHGKWTTVSKHDTQGSAEDCVRSITGLWDKAVFHGGKRIEDGTFVCLICEQHLRIRDKVRGEDCCTGCEQDARYERG